MTYAIVTCRKCRNNRIIDRSSSSSKCPYCSTAAEHKELRILFEDNDQSVVREALSQLNGFEPPPQKERPAVDHDPFSTLVYKYEKCRDLQDRMDLLSKGLTEIFGTFTLEDIEKVDPKNAEKMLKAMVDLCLIHETEYGRFRA